jgi:PAS domain S-box-containing protein
MQEKEYPRNTHTSTNFTEDEKKNLFSYYSLEFLDETDEDEKTHPQKFLVEKEQLSYGDHVCALYDKEEEHRAIVSSLINDRMSQKDKVIYLSNAQSKEEVIKYLQEDIKDASIIESVRFSVIPCPRKGDSCDLDAIIPLLQARIGHAENVSIICEIDKIVTSEEAVLKFEQKLHELISTRKRLSVCFYNKRNINAHILLSAIWTHPFAMIGTKLVQNQYFVNPEKLINTDHAVIVYDHYEDCLTKGFLSGKTIYDEERWYQQFVDLLPQSIWEIDKQGNFTFMNKFMRERFGFTTDRLEKGVNIQDILSPSLKEKLFSMQPIINGSPEKGIYGETVVVNKDGEEVPVALYILPASRKQGRERVRGITINLKAVKEKEEALKQKQEELTLKNIELEETNTAMKVLLKRVDSDKGTIEDQMLANVKNRIMPYVRKLKESNLREDQAVYIKLIETNINEIVSPFIAKLSSTHTTLTPKEIQVSTYIKDGMTTKEIAKMLNVSTNAIDLHRHHIRQKLGLNKKKMNLVSYLLSLS